MRVLVATDVHVWLYNGKKYVAGQVVDILRRYAESFGALVLCARVVCDREPPEGMVDASEYIAEEVPFASLSGALAGRFRKELTAVIAGCDLAVGRFHSIVGCVAYACAAKAGKPFLAEVMGDAWDAYWNHGIIGRMIAPVMYLSTRRSVRNADYALYVTQEYLQKRYPCRGRTAGVSNVLLRSLDTAVPEKRAARIGRMDETHITLCTTAAVDVRYKGQEYVIRALPILKQRGITADYVLIGGGDQRYLKQIAETCGVGGQVRFAGRVPLQDVFKIIDDVDVYVQPSLQEGLPRSVIEAMSRGCPAIGAATAGIPELLAPECVFRRRSAQAVADTLIRINDRKTLASLAEQNFDRSREYLDDVLHERRKAFFESVKDDLRQGVCR